MYTNDDRSSELKKLSDLLRTAAGKPRKSRTAAIIVAAGSSSRMGGPDKLHLPLCGMPVVVHSLLAYEAAAYIDVICAVVKKDDISLFETYREKFAIKKLTLIVPGSDTRQKSVLRGVEALSEYNPDYFAIADGARPLTDPRTIDLCCLAAYRFGAATAAVPATDTVKIRDARGFITETPDRSNCVLAATPQVFSANLYRAAAYTALEAGFEATDDNSLVERIGRQVFTVECPSDNIKITLPSDLAAAEAYMKLRINTDTDTPGGTE